MRQTLQRPQAAAGGAVLAGAEGHAGIQHQGDAAGRGARRQMGAADREAAADALLGKARLRAGEPALDRGFPAMQRRLRCRSPPRASSSAVASASSSAPASFTPSTRQVSAASSRKKPTAMHARPSAAS